MKLRWAGFVFLFLRVGLGAVFVVSGFQKLASPAENFAAVIEQYELVRGSSALWIARVLPWIEFVPGVMLVLGLWTRLSTAALWALNTGFMALLSWALWRKLPIEQCGCFGSKFTLSPTQMLGIDAALWTFFLIFFATHRRVETPSLDRFLK